MSIAQLSYQSIPTDIIYIVSMLSIMLDCVWTCNIIQDRI